MIQFMSITQGITIHLTIILIRIRCLLSLGPPSTNIHIWENQSIRILTTAIIRQEATSRSIPVTTTTTTTQPICRTREVEALRAGMLAEAVVYRMITNMVETMVTTIFRKISDIEEKENKNLSLKFSMILVRKSQTILMNFAY